MTLYPSPDQLLGKLFQDVQLSSLFSDSKTFVDATPRLAPENLLRLYDVERQKPGFKLETFVRQYFILPESPLNDFVSDTSMLTSDHIRRLWDKLVRPADDLVAYSSLLSLPHRYVVPGGRFREIFYWDSYFTMLGLRQSGRNELIRGMVDNFAYLIDKFGFIPNGNRTYFLTRSQPPFFGLMVELLAEIDGPDTLLRYLPYLRREYDFWMKGHDQLTGQSTSYHIASFADGSILNRYWDSTPTPRPEAFLAETALASEAEQLGILPHEMYCHLRAACESGWDYSSRWIADGKQMPFTRAADIIPVDLNCLLFSLEHTLQKAYQLNGQLSEATRFVQKAAQRKHRIRHHFWNDQFGFYMDVDTVTGQHTSSLTLAGLFPLFFNLATPEQAERIHERLQHDFLQMGGWVTTLVQSGQQWDWPNGWAPLQWIVYQSLLNYGFTETARKGRDRWLTLNDKVFRMTGKMMEKYNVVDDILTADGGKYPNQDGFGWTNGVYLALLDSV